MVSIVAAVAKNGVIGRNGNIPWDIPEDRAYFRKLTTGGAVIMGRRTYAEIGHPLPERYNIIVSRTLHLQGEMLCTAGSLAEAIRISHLRGLEAFLCGGERIYTEGMAYAQRLYLSELEAVYEGDTFFPFFSEETFQLTERIRSESGKLWYAVYKRQETRL